MSGEKSHTSDDHDYSQEFISGVADAVDRQKASERQPSVWAMKAAEGCHARLLGGTLDHPALKNLTDTELAACCAIIDAAWEEHLEQNVKLFSFQRDIMRDAKVYAAKVDALVAAAKRYRDAGTVTTEWNDLDEALAALEK